MTSSPEWAFIRFLDRTANKGERIQRQKFIPTIHEQQLRRYDNETERLLGVIHTMQNTEREVG